MNVTKVIKYKAGYEVRTKKFDDDEISEGPGFTMRSAYTPDGHYIGDPRTARFLCVKYGIKPELRTPTSKTCSVGYSKQKQKWYGWSHRAIFGFDTRKEAEDFAESVS